MGFFPGNFSVSASAPICNAAVLSGEASLTSAASNPPDLLAFLPSPCSFPLVPLTHILRLHAAALVESCCRDGAAAVFLRVASQEVFCRPVWAHRLAGGGQRFFFTTVPPSCFKRLALSFSLPLFASLLDWATSAQTQCTQFYPRPMLFMHNLFLFHSLFLQQF